MSFFRYPGGKAKLRDQILSKLCEGLSKDDTIIEYREPFLGGGKITTELLTISGINSFWINDFDFGIACLWFTVINNPIGLIELIQKFTPSVDYFYTAKKQLLEDIKFNDLTNEERLLYGFKKLTIHQLSFSGLGTKSGGPLGGKEQKSKYKIDCRWSPGHLSKNINKLNSLFKNKHIKCSSLDFSELITNDEVTALLYLDPPYFVKGQELYQCGFNYQDHIRLADSLKNTKHFWTLSYDNCEEISSLYMGWANIEIINNINYSINTARNFKTELLISNF